MQFPRKKTYRIREKALSEGKKNKIEKEVRMISRHLIRFVFNLCVHFRWWSVCRFSFRWLFLVALYTAVILFLVAFVCGKKRTAFFFVLIWRQRFWYGEIDVKCLCKIERKQSYLCLLLIRQLFLIIQSQRVSVDEWQSIATTLNHFTPSATHKQQMDACKAPNSPSFAIHRLNLNILL